MKESREGRGSLPNKAGAEAVMLHQKNLEASTFQP